MLELRLGLPRGGRFLSVLATVLLLLASRGAIAQDPPREESWKKESEQRFETIRPGDTIRVVNPLGSVYARFGGYENRVEIIATTQYQEPHPPPVVSSSPTEFGLEVTTRPGSSAGESNTTPVPCRVDLVVFVPLGASLDARADHDGIEIKGVRGNVIASSLTGDIRIRSVEGAVRAKSARGRISAGLETGVTQEPQDFTTETGDLEVYLWEDAAMTVRIATSGEISTDFSLQIEHRRHEEPGKHALAVIGKGGPELILTSKRGHVSLLRLPKEIGSDGEPSDD